MIVQALRMMAGPAIGSIQCGEVVDMPEEMAHQLLAAEPPVVKVAAGMVARRKVERPIQDRERDVSQREAALAVRAAELEKREAELATREQTHNRRGR